MSEIRSSAAAPRSVRRYSNLQGQAVLNGVMIRSDRHVAIAVRQADGRIRVRSHAQAAAGLRMRGLPLIRGAVAFLEALFHGVESLVYSVHPPGRSRDHQGAGIGVVMSLLGVLVLVGFIFVLAPHWVAGWVSRAVDPDLTAESWIYRVTEGCVRLLALFAYLLAASRIPGVRSLFRFHGAEHQAVHAFESGQELTIENARGRAVIHPRCPTAFLLSVVIAAVFFFAFLFPWTGSLPVTDHPGLNRTALVVLKMFLLFPLAGVVYEWVLLGSARMENPLFRILTAPVRMVQVLIVRRPDDRQLEVALTSLRQVLRLGKGIPSPSKQQRRSGGAGDDPLDPGDPTDEDEFEISGLAELGKVQATVDEFASKW